MNVIVCHGGIRPTLEAMKFRDGDVDNVALIPIQQYVTNPDDQAGRHHNLS